jgi:hypothetical protein
MLELIAIGIVLYGIFLGMYVYYHDYIQTRPEGFMNVPQPFVEKVVPGGNEERTNLSPGLAFDVQTEKLLNIPIMDKETALQNWGKMTSETCYHMDQGEQLKPTRNFLQRTNNYLHTSPDSCSAPNHEFVGTFYNPFDGVGSAPESGKNIPLSATCLR